MSRAHEHHAKAEQLLGQARTTQDQIGRRLILAGAQVHATLALSAPAEKGPPGPGQSETSIPRTRGGRSDSARARAAVHREPGPVQVPVPPRPTGPPDPSDEAQLPGQSARPAEPASQAPDTTVRLPTDTVPARPGTQPLTLASGSKDPAGQKRPSAPTTPTKKYRTTSATRNAAARRNRDPAGPDPSSRSQVTPPAAWL